MGYYLDFVFDPETTRDTVTERIRVAGGVRVPLDLLPKPLDEFWWPLNHGDPPPWIRATPGVLVRVYKREATPAGNWADTRLSWGTERHEWALAMGPIFSFAERLSCRVWDGQIAHFVGRDEWESLILRHFYRAASDVTGLVGTVESERVETTTTTTPRPRSTHEDEWDWSVRTERCLTSAGIATLDELAQRTASDLLEIPNLSERGLREIRERLASYGMALRDESHAAGRAFMPVHPLKADR